jgi:MFS transporter, PPP family, 3-phenylpropionic acid transporter
MIAFVVNYFFLFVTSAIYFPYLQLFLKARGFSASQVGVLLACSQIAGILGPLLIARLADKTGKFRLITLFSIGASVGTWALLEFVAPSRLWGFAPFMLLLGIGLNSLIPLLDGLASKQLTDPARQYGRLRAIGSIGFIVSSFVLQFAGLIDGTSSLSIFRCFVAAGVIYAVAVAFLPQAAAHRVARERAKGAGLNGSFWIGIVVIFLAWLSLVSYQSFFSLFAQAELGVASVSWLFAVAGLSEIPWIFFSGPLVRRFGLWGIFLFCLAVTVGRLVMYALLHGVAAIVVAQLLHGISFGLLHAGAIQFVNRKVPHARLGLGIALYLSLGVGLANFTGSLIGGFVIEWLGFRSMYLIYTIPALVGIVILFVARGSFDGRGWKAASSAAGSA